MSNTRERINAIARSAAGERKYTLAELEAHREQENLRLSQEIAQRKRKAAQDKAIGRSGIEPLYQGCTVKNFEADTPDKNEAKRFAYDYIVKFDDNIGRGFIFGGREGTGKNHLASAICNALIKSGKSCLVITVNELMQKIRNTYHGDSQITEDQFIRSMIDYDLLILDEIGLQRGTDAERLAINQIVDQRISRMKPTGMLTNEEAANVKEILGARVMDRMKMNGGRWISFNWESYRK